MKTAHEFARELLAMSDFPIVHPIVKEYNEDVEHSGNPVATVEEGEDSDGNKVSLIVLSYIE